LIYKILSRDYGALLTSAALFILSYAPSPFAFLIYIAFIPFLVLLENKKPGESFRYGYLLGLLVSSATYYWLINFKFSTFILITLYYPIHIGLFASIYSYLNNSQKRMGIFLFPFLWTLLEYSREWGDIALNWLNIGYTQATYLKMVQFADIFGLNGVTFWICLINLFFFLLLFERETKINSYIFTLIIALLFIFPYIYGNIRLNESQNSKGIEVTIIQPNIDSYKKWDKNYQNQIIDDHLKLTKESALNEYSLIVWPETAIPFPLSDAGSEASELKEFTMNCGLIIITGTLHKKNNLLCNSTALISDSNNLIQFYDKIKLVPGEEGLPFLFFYKFLLSESYKSNFYEYGDNHKVFYFEAKTYNLEKVDTKWHRISMNDLPENIGASAIICFESSFQNFIPKFINNGAQLIVVVTNDEWFGYSQQPVQHVNTSIIRAIENRISIVHCSNAGISAFIDPYGQIIKEIDLYSTGTITDILPLKAIIGN